MAHVLQSARVARHARSLWREIGSFGDVGRWHPMLAALESEGEEPGARRWARTKSGSTQIERLANANPLQRSYIYAIESTPMPVKNYVAELRVDDNGDGTSTVVWQGEFDVRDEVAAQDRRRVVSEIEDFFRAGLDRLKEQYDS
jgi:mxaD protein